MKVLAGVLVITVATLIWALYSLNDHRRQSAAQQQSNEVVILDFSNRWETTRRSLDEQKRVNDTLETNLTSRASQLETLRTEIANLNSTLARSRAETRSAQDEVAKRDDQISTLEGRNVDLTKQMGALQTALAGLEEQIAEAERQLSSAEGNRQELLEEIRRLQSEKVEMEKQLNDLAFLRDQVRKLKEELTIARRLDWIRRGIYGATPKKGAEALAEMKFGGEPAPTAATSGTPSLDVELRSSGEVRVNAPTNAPAPP